MGPPCGYILHQRHLGSISLTLVTSTNCLLRFFLPYRGPPKPFATREFALNAPPLHDSFLYLLSVFMWVSIIGTMAECSSCVVDIFLILLFKTPEIIDVSFNKGRGGMGISIVAAKVNTKMASRDSHTNIYFFSKIIKSVNSEEKTLENCQIRTLSPAQLTLLLTIKCIYRLRARTNLESTSNKL